MELEIIETTVPEEITSENTETSTFESALSMEDAEETTTTTTTSAYLPVDEQLSYVRSDLDMLLGLVVAFMVIELCKWSYRLLNIFFPI